LTLAAAVLIPAGLHAQLTSAGALPHFATGGGWRTTWVIVNPLNNASGAVQLNFIGDNGTPAVIPLVNAFASQVLTPASSFSAPVPPHSMVVIYSDAGGPSATQGWTQVSTDSATTTVVEIFRYTSLPNPKLCNSSSVQQGEASPQNASVTTYVIPFSEMATSFTAIAIANLATNSITPTVRVRDYSGNTLASDDSFTLGALAHTSFLVAQKYPAAAGTAGVIEFQTGQPGLITVLGLGFDSNYDAFFSVPPIGVNPSN
jgi:hypothetical protein